MAIVREEVLDKLFDSASAAFEKGKPSTPSDWEKVATKVSSNTESQTYHWLGRFPNIEKWVGARVLKNMKAHGYTIKNETYQSAVNISVDEINDDKAGVYSPMFQEMGREAIIYPNDYIFTALKNGFKELCYDGQYFFDADHPVGGKTVANLTAPDSPTGNEIAWYVLDTTSTLKPLIFQEREQAQLKQLNYRVEEYNEYVYAIKTRFSVGYGFWQRAFASTKPLTAENLKEVMSLMKALKDENGKPLKINPSLLVVPSSLEWKAKDILNKEFAKDNAGNVTESNVLYKALGLLVSSYLD